MNKNKKTPLTDSTYYCSQLPTSYVEGLPNQTPLTQPLDNSQLSGNGQSIETIRSSQSSGLSAQTSMLDRHVFALNQRNKAAQSADNLNKFYDSIKN